MALASQVAHLLDIPVAEDSTAFGRDRSDVDDELEQEEIQYLRQRDDAAGRTLLLMSQQLSQLRRQETYLIDLCGCPHRSIYADTATMPRCRQ